MRALRYMGFMWSPSELDTYILKWYVARHVLKIGHQKGMCYNEISMCIQISQLL